MDIGLNIIYNEAENSSGSIDTFLGMPTDVAKVLIPILVSFLIFALGILINLYFKKRDRHNELISFRTTIITWGDLIKNPAIDQALSCRVFANRLLTNRNILPETISFSLFQANNLTSIEIKKYVDTFVTNYNGKLEDNAESLYLLISQFNLFNKLQDDIEKNYFIYQKRVLELEEEWANTFSEVDKLTDLYYQDIWNNSSHIYYPLLKNITTISNKYFALQNRNTFLTKTNLIEPLEAACNAALNANSAHEYALRYLQPIRKLNRIYYQWLSHNKGTRIQFFNYGQTLITSVKTIDKSFKVLHKGNIKSLWTVK